MVEKEVAMQRLRTLVDEESMMSPVRKFIEYHGWDEEYTKWDVREFLNKMEEKGYSKNYMRMTYYAIKNLFEAMDLEWGLSSRKDLPKVPGRSESRTPVMSKEQVEDLIYYVIREGEDYEEFYACCSTIYGMRRKELHQIKPEDLKFKENREDEMNEDTIMIRTRKGGEQREQWIHPDIKPVFKDYKFRIDFRKNKVNIMNDIFDDMIEKTGIEKKEGMGWHSIRRALRTEMGRELRIVREEGGAGVVESDIYKFMRWRRQDEEGKMLSIYDKSSYIEGDKEVFKIHPFLDFWR